MLIRISRTLFWVSAVAAAVALAAPERAGTWLTALAGIALLGSFGCWRVAAAQRRADDGQDDTIEPVRLDDAGLVDAAVRVARAVAASPDLDAALLAALQGLRAELGCREAAVHRVVALEPPIARLVTLIDAGPGGRGIEHRVRLDQAPLGVALREQSPTGADAGPFAIPVLRDGAPIAVLELGRIALEVEPALLEALFELVALHLGEAAQVDAARLQGEARAAGAPPGQFIAGMSHEIRTPMNGILGMAELLLGTALDDKQRGFAQAVHRSGEVLLEIIDDILDYARIEAGRLELVPEAFAPRQVVEDTLELLAGRAQDKRLELGFREESGLPVIVHGDALRLRQVLSHLVANAITFTERGEVLVDLRRAAAAAPGGDTLLLEFGVRDTGIGIAAEALPRLFDPFSQAGDGLARRDGRSGLGLALSRRLVELMGGTISVRSAPGIGSEFHFTLPVRPLADDSLGERMLPAVTSSRADGLGAQTDAEWRVLVVEDNNVNQEVIGQMLRRLGCRAEVVSGATEGLRALCEESFDLILMDIQMPDMDGIEALRCFRHEGGGRFPFLTSRHAPVVAVTANALGGDERRFRDLGFDDYLPKPFRQSQLLAMLLRHLSPPAAPLPADAPSAGLPAATVLDAAALDKLRELDPKSENKLLERVMKAFETSVARLLPQLQEAHRRGDHAGVRHVVHTLKASSASIGALVLSQQCAEIETRIRLGEPDGLDGRIEAVYGELENVLKAVRPWTDGKA